MWRGRSSREERVSRRWSTSKARDTCTAVESQPRATRTHPNGRVSTHIRARSQLCTTIYLLHQKMTAQTRGAAAPDTVSTESAGPAGPSAPVDPNVHHLPQATIYANAFVAGGVSLAASFAIMHPLDTLKTQMQAAAGTSKGGPAAKAGATQAVSVAKGYGRDAAKAVSANVVSAAKTVPKAGSTSLLRGFGASVLGAAPQGALRWMTYEVTKHQINSVLFGPTGGNGIAAANGLSPSQPSNSGLKPSRNSSAMPSLLFVTISAVSAIAGDTASSVIKVPREVVTARLQTGFYEKQGLGKLSGFQVLKRIVREEGVRGLFRGFSSTTARDWPFMAMLFVLYDSFKAAHWHYTLNMVPQEEFDAGNVPEYTITTMKSVLFGGIAGGLAAFATTPFDVIKTKIMTASTAETITKKPLTIGATARALLESQRAKVAPNGVLGVGSALGLSRVFFTGAVARSTWWFCVCSMFFPIYERTKDYLDSRSEQRLLSRAVRAKDKDSHKQMHHSSSAAVSGPTSILAQYSTI